MDVLREVGNIGAGNAVTALSKMLNRRVNMEVPKVKVLELKEVSGILGSDDEPVVGVLLKVSGDITGAIMFILDYKAARILVNKLMQREFNVDEAFDEIELSALKEIGNILTASYVSALSLLSGLSIKPSIPDIAIDMAGAIISVPAIEFGKAGDTVLYIETEFNEGSTKVVGDFFLVPDLESYDILLKALGVSD